MTRAQHLMCKLAEEAAEVGQRAMKMQQYGPAEVEPNQPLNNAGRLREEMLDLLAIYELMRGHGLVPAIRKVDVDRHLDGKREKIGHYRLHSIRLGMVEP